MTEDQPVGRFAAGLVGERRWRGDDGGGSGGTLSILSLQVGEEVLFSQRQRSSEEEEGGAKRSREKEQK